MIWIFYAIANVLTMLFCYITNPIVCLFCNEEGELPKALRMWQTWDDSCNPQFYVKEHAPKFLRYDYDKHYEEYWATTPQLEAVGRDRCFARVIDPHFTWKERLQRYACRVLWLTRNCGYGFAFWCYGRFVDGNNIEYIKKKDDVRISYDKSKNVLTRPWSYKDERHLFGNVYLNIYVGWKINTDTDKKQCMIATRVIAFNFGK